ncbi:unnamed protein product [Porites evermanni]|uniref:Ion transport domain-containing protein n=1 Tax=Porites evermanni TaxID=104178 RepID=A0ABN8T471_9CNID|nr:unnamed protein product [Porites evermanni]
MIALFTLLGCKLFGKRNLKDIHGKPYFTNYLDVFFLLYVLTTTANNPDVMMPAYDNNPWSSLFFVIFIIVCMYIFVSIFLAVVYKNYRKHLKKKEKEIPFKSMFHCSQMCLKFRLFSRPKNTFWFALCSFSYFSKITPEFSPVLSYKFKYMIKQLFFHFSFYR